MLHELYSSVRRKKNEEEDNDAHDGYQEDHDKHAIKSQSQLSAKTVSNNDRG